MKILSPMPSGNGAYVLHKQLESRTDGYRVRRYSPWWTLAPITLPWFARGRQLDMIHCDLNYACFFKRSGVPLVVTIHNYVLDTFMEPYSSLLQRVHYRTDLKWFTRQSLKQANCITAVSQFLADIVRKESPSAPDIRVIYNGIDEAIFHPVTAQRRGGPFRILFSGNLTRRKRADTIVPLARALGAGFEIHYTSGLAGGELPTEDVGAGKVVALGRVPFDDMHKLYQSMDALFMPSVREGFGLAVAEAMACGLPVVANNCSAIPELLTDGDGGFLCGVGQIGQYAEAFEKLMDTPQLCRSMGEFNRAEVEEKFTLSRMVNQYKCLFESVR